jgi:hypothetical protein
MLVATDAGSSYNEVEYTRWMKAAGFTKLRRINLPGPSDLSVGLVKIEPLVRMRGHLTLGSAECSI